MELTNKQIDGNIYRECASETKKEGIEKKRRLLTCELKQNYARVASGFRKYFTCPL